MYLGKVISSDIVPFVTNAMLMDPECERTIGQTIRRLMSSQTIQCSDGLRSDSMGHHEDRGRLRERKEVCSWLFIQNRNGNDGLPKWPNSLNLEDRGNE